MAKNERPAGRGRPRKHRTEPDSAGRTGTPVSIRLDPEIRGLIPAFVVEFRRRHDVKLTMTDVVEMALTRLYREYGLLPPAEGDRAASASG